MADIIIYNQKELDAAIAAGISDIMLCAGIYTIPLTENTVFSRLGPVKADVICSQGAAEAEGMSFIGFEPVFHDRFAVDLPSSLAPVAVTGNAGSFIAGSGYISSGIGSFSYGSGSFGSGVYGYYYEYEFEYGHRNAFGSGSFSGSYSLYSSFGESYLGSARGAFMLYPLDDTIEALTIKVFGYGINLI